MLGNGDIWEADDALRMMRETGADGVVVGRGCLGRPWLFRDLAEVFDGGASPRPPTGRGARRHGRTRRAAGRLDGRGALRDFRKHTGWYLTGIPVGGEFRRRLQEIGSLADLDDVLDAIDREARLPIDALRIARSHKGGPKRRALPDGWLADPPPVALGEEAEALVSGG